MGDETVVSVSHYVQWSDVYDIEKNRKFEYIPAIAYVIQKGTSKKIETNLFYFPKAFSLWELGLPIEIILEYAKNELERREELKVARKAYLKLKAYANRCAERVLADLNCALLLKTLNSDDQVIFFIEGPPSNKIVARLGYLYPSLENLTICFLSFKPEDLLTSVMSFQAGRLEYDIHRLLLEERTDFLGPYPGTSAESLVQTYFYRPPELSPGIKVSPLRIDIFTQGLMESEFYDKKEIIRKKLEDGYWTTTYTVKHPIETILPKGLRTAIESWELYKKDLEIILKHGIYGEAK